MITSGFLLLGFVGFWITVSALIGIGLVMMVVGGTCCGGFGRVVVSACADAGGGIGTSGTLIVGLGGSGCTVVDASRLGTSGILGVGSVGLSGTDAEIGGSNTGSSVETGRSGIGTLLVEDMGSLVVAGGLFMVGLCPGSAVGVGSAVVGTNTWPCLSVLGGS